VTDTDAAYSKDVPAGALPYAEVAKIGGLTRKCKNLLPYPYYDTTKTVHGVTFTDNGDGSITAKGTATANAVFYLVYGERLGALVSGHTYSGYKTSGNYWQMCNYYDSEGVSKKFLGVTGGVSQTNTYPDGTVKDVIYIVVIKGTTIDETIYPMLNEGDTALPPEPYFEGLRSAPVTEIESVVDGVDVRHVLTVPEAVQVLDGYGESNPDNGAEYNYIEFENREFVACGHIVNDVWVAYDTVQKTDISDILPADNYIEVEGGGTLTFKNEYGYDVPSEVTYQIEEVSE
jgi:hypothetical protein